MLGEEEWRGRACMCIRLHFFENGVYESSILLIVAARSEQLSRSGRETRNPDTRDTGIQHRGSGSFSGADMSCMPSPALLSRFYHFACKHMLSLSLRPPLALLPSFPSLPPIPSLRRPLSASLPPSLPSSRTGKSGFGGGGFGGMDDFEEMFGRAGGGGMGGAYCVRYV